MVHAREQSARLNVLLTEDAPSDPEHWTGQLSRLLQPQGVAAYVARSGVEAIDLVERVDIHAAVIDMNTPAGQGRFTFTAPQQSSEPAGIWLMELIRRLPNRPPIVVVKRRAASDPAVRRMLQAALRLGAFSVMHKPVELEQLLDVFRRLVDRRYRGAWPDGRKTGRLTQDQ